MPTNDELITASEDPVESVNIGRHFTLCADSASSTTRVAFGVAQPQQKSQSPPVIRSFPIAVLLPQVILSFVGTMPPLANMPSAAPLPLPMQDVRKRQSQRVIATNSAGPNACSRMFFMCDKVSGRRFMVDNGAELSVIPPSLTNRRNLDPGFTLQAVNKTSISTYGRRLLSLNFGLRRNFSFVFVIADVSTALLGADFLDTFDLKVDVRRSRLENHATASAFRVGCLPAPPWTSASVAVTTRSCYIHPVLQKLGTTSCITFVHLDRRFSPALAVCYRESRIRAHAAVGHHSPIGKQLGHTSSYGSEIHAW